MFRWPVRNFIYKYNFRCYLRLSTNSKEFWDTYESLRVIQSIANRSVFKTMLKMTEKFSFNEFKGDISLALSSEGLD